MAKSKFLSILIALLFIGTLRAEEPAKVESALADYVKSADKSYEWKKIDGGKVGVTEYAELYMVSQTWKEIPWKHQLFLIKPSTIKKENTHALLFITGGRWREEYEVEGRKTKLPREAAIFAGLAEQLGSPIAILQQVPHQPIFEGKVEDQIIAYTFEQFIRTDDTTWPLLLPMVKSAVRGMDTIQTYSKENWDHEIKTFTISGASKRGWTTWLTGAVDPRATAIAPMVIDVLNMPEQMKHQKASYKEFSEEIADYTERGLPDLIESPKGASLCRIVDPFSYRAELKQPKLIFLGTNDAYWTVDALNLYWDELVGEKYVLYVPNRGHSLDDLTRVVGTMHGFQQHVSGICPLPDLKWDIGVAGGDFEFKVTSKEEPTAVRVWTAKSDSRDFRKATWTSQELTYDKSTGVVNYRQVSPETGYCASFIECEYVRDNLPLYLSTNLRVVGGAEKKKE